MFKKIISYHKRLDYSPIFSFSQKRRGLKYRYRRQVNPDEPCYYVPLQQTEPKIIDYVEEEGAVETKFNRYSLHPHSYWITQGKGSERPFTGEHWDRKDVGHYECVVCSSTLFLSDHKFFPPTGMASFWNSVKGAIELADDVAELKEDKTNLTTKLYEGDHKKQRCMCAKCKAHLGTIHYDGPPPLFVRYSINSGALHFKEKGWFHPPQYYRQLRKLEASKSQQGANDNSDVVEKFEIDREKFAQIDKSAKQEK